MKFDAKWIWYEGIPQNNCGRNEVCYLRKKFYLTKDAYKLRINVTADSRYKLYLNGKIIGFGPEKGDRWRYYFDVIDITEDLCEGWNVISAVVIHYYPAEPWIYHRGGPGSVYRTATGGFLFEGYVFDRNESLMEKILTDDSWLIYRDEAIEFLPSKHMPLVGEVERVKGELLPNNWTTLDFDDSAWKNAVVIDKDRSLNFNPEETLNELFPPWSLVKRDIPLLYQEERNFVRVIPDGDLLVGMTLEPNRHYSFILDAGELTTGFPCLKIRGGKGSKIELTYAECFSFYNPDRRLEKRIRDDSSGIIIGDTDTFYPSGKDDYYEPFWFRTFRFIKVDIEVGDSPLLIDKIWFREIEYPIKIEGRFRCSDEEIDKVWNVSIRTLKRCMHETYEDCPYYEQMQYTMDSMLEALYTYQISRDYSLARKAIYDFHSSLLPSGLLQSRYPSVAPQVIPVFSLYWIIMLRDYVLYTGEIDLIKRYRPTIDSILIWFERHLNDKNLVDKIGYWPYIDWVDGWEWGMPSSFISDVPIIYSLIYSYTLKVASNLMLMIGCRGLFKEYKIRSMLIDKAIKKLCWDENLKLFKDAPKTNQFSQHCQIWAILNEIVKSDNAKECLKNALSREDISKVSISYSFFLFRALDKTGLYNRYAPFILDMWKNLLAFNVTTFPEVFKNPRSECHGWSAVPIYEFVASILGIRPSEPGFRKVDIKPHPLNLEWAEGVIPTVRGDISLRWERDSSSFIIYVSSRKDIKLRLILSSIELHNPVIFINDSETTFRIPLELPGGDYKIVLKEGAD